MNTNSIQKTPEQQIGETEFESIVSTAGEE